MADDPPCKAALSPRGTGLWGLPFRETSRPHLEAGIPGNRENFARAGVPGRAEAGRGGGAPFPVPNRCAPPPAGAPQGVGAAPPPGRAGGGGGSGGGGGGAQAGQSLRPGRASAAAAAAAAASGSRAGGAGRASRAGPPGDEDGRAKMELASPLLGLLLLLEGIAAQGVYAPPTVRIIHSGLACNIEEERYSERVYTIREGETLELTCLVTGHPRPQIRWTKTAGSASDRFQDSSVYNETLRIANIQRHQGGRYYCKAENGLGSPAIKSIRVDVYCCPELHHSPPQGEVAITLSSSEHIAITLSSSEQGETKILKLKNLRPQDYANYSCIASVRSVCNISDKMVSFRLSNKTASPSIKLLVDDPIVVNPGEAITLVCVTTGGEPLPTLTWVRSIGALPEKAVLKGGTLTIPTITFDDAGAYSCIANNNVGNPAKKSTNIIVRALKKGRFWITPDPYHKDDNIQIGREVKISCQVEAVPSEELTFSWFKNGRPLRSSERMVITQTDPDVSPGTTNLDIIDLKFTDFGTYTCVASLKGGGISDISIDVNISSSTALQKKCSSPLTRKVTSSQGENNGPDLVRVNLSASVKPVLVQVVATTGLGRSPERNKKYKHKKLIGGLGEPRNRNPTVSRLQRRAVTNGQGILRISVLLGYANHLIPNMKNGTIMHKTLALESDPPAVEPTFLEIRQGQGRSVTMSCRVLRAYPTRVLTFEWRLGNKLLRTGQFDAQDSTEYIIRSLSRDSYGVYNCNIINEAGAGRPPFPLRAQDLHQYFVKL
ncbi:MAM domain-containing glycosylphosphatidylinositol anchor protein 2-like [Sphaerodactylus townsendi]|uniref:MAM domain-containing glycosylphosphatidylinositol anchor protein 2-like n=1 Tax=Sphaerodactylus townsendi TaxID=933632 RepID=UPI002026AC50|nr:MAM domain-containing glycosylphosphatidylinositol anchor protein 2-like [Sphaerodactylus townsendi]